jgi:hypothetical protein
MLPTPAAALAATTRKSFGRQFQRPKTVLSLGERVAFRASRFAVRALLPAVGALHARNKHCGIERNITLNQCSKLTSSRVD